jgi:hypothetical protein
VTSILLWHLCEVQRLLFIALDRFVCAGRNIMYSILNQELARQHQAALMREAATERALRHTYKRTNSLSTQPVVLSQRSLSEADFAAIRRDLRAVLSEWCLEPGTTRSEDVLDSFMGRLRRHLGYAEQREKSGALS